MDRVASIDIGTNTILLLVAEVKKGVLKPLLEKETIVRLGEGLQQTGVLSEAAMQRGFQTLTRYLEECDAMGARRIFAVGTNPLREAKNAREFLKRVEEKLNLPIEILTGEEEAHLSFLAVSRDLGNHKKSMLVVDVGGGSTEFVLGKGDRVSYWKSLPMGSVRFTEQFLLSDPVREEEWRDMKKKIHEYLEEVPRSRESFDMVAVGGTATTLASVELGLQHFVYEKIHHFVLERKTLKSQLEGYRSRPLEERKKIPGLSSARADVILAGGTILYISMERFAVPAVLIYKKLQRLDGGFRIEKSKTCHLTPTTRFTLARRASSEPE